MDTRSAKLRHWQRDEGDNNGDFSILWTDSQSSGNVVVKVSFQPIHQNNERVWVTNSTGSYYNFNAVSNATLYNGTTTDIGNRFFGANEVLDVWDGVVMTWRGGLRESARMDDFFGMRTPDGSGATRLRVSTATESLRHPANPWTVLLRWGSQPMTLGGFGPPTSGRVARYHRTVWWTAKSL